MAIFQSDADRRCYLQNVKEETERFGVEILSWCLMTNHVHFIAVPREDTSFARGFGEAHRKYTRMKNFSDGFPPKSGFSANVENYNNSVLRK
ncbi:MAG: transposase [Proteobacteria bacterium]|nr:transposase [Pseudomonadota bacterium]MBU4582736.1 transposase [Pseudomonadota bacterium]